MVTFNQALNDKYVDQQEIEDMLIVPKDDKISTDIMFVGFGKVTSIQKQLIGLTNIDLSNCNINSSGNFDELKGCLDRVKVLNLSENQLSWNDVLTITNNLPRLRELILTNNKQLFLEEFVNKGSKKNLLSLTLGRTPVKWSTIVAVLAESWTSVEQIDLWDSKLDNDAMKLSSTHNDELTEFIHGIKVMKLSHNNFHSIDWIIQAGTLVNLIELDLSKCKLDTFTMSDQIVLKLAKLETLNISYNNLKDWKDISNLYKLGCLISLICHENPLFILEKDAKLLTIGRLSQIKFINREEISENTRKDSEVLYIRRSFADYQLFCKGCLEDFKSIHPKYEKLAEIYGIPEDLTRRQVIDKYVSVDLCYNNKKITKKLPCDMRIANLKMLIKRLFNLRPSVKIQITCRDAGQLNSSLNYELDKDGQTLHFFSVKNGHELSIDEAR